MESYDVAQALCGTTLLEIASVRIERFLDQIYSPRLDN